MVVSGKSLSKGFLQSEVLGEVSVLEGGSSGRSFSRSLPSEVFHEVFGLVLLGHSEQTKKTSAATKKTSALNSHDPAQQTFRAKKKNFSKKNFSPKFP